MKQEIKESTVTFVDGKRINEMTVVYTYDKSDDMKSKANFEIDAAELQRRRERIIESYRVATLDSDKERLMLKLESVDKNAAEVAAKILVYEKYLEGYDAQ